jgi:hypothetical protein
MEGIGEIKTNGYGQLWALFQASIIDLQSGAILEKTLAFVRMHREMLTSRLSRLLKCMLLIWALERNNTRQIGIHVSNEQGFREYDVVEILNILRIIHVIPNIVEDNHFFVNKYKF